MAMEYDVQRLELGDVVLIDLGDGAGQVEAKVVRFDRPEPTFALRVDAFGWKGATTRPGVGVGEKVT